MRSFVVTGDGRGIGRAIAERLSGDVGHVVVIDVDAESLAWVGPPEEVAAAVAFLLSGSAGYVIGAVLPVDGGRAAQGQDPEVA